MEARKTHNLDRMIAVACGTRTQVDRWGDVLRLAAIDFYVAEGAEPPCSDADERLEVWVAQEDAEGAHHSLRSSSRSGEPNLW